MGVPLHDQRADQAAVLEMKNLQSKIYANLNFQHSVQNSGFKKDPELSV
jgi:hypothetical protein